MKPIWFTRGSRIGKTSAYHVSVTSYANVSTDEPTSETTLSWIGPDERG